MAFVLDTSVALAWILPDESNAETDLLCDRLLQERVVVPAVWSLEVGNALLMAVRRGRIGEKDMARLVAQLTALPIDVDQDSATQALGEVLSLANRLKLTTYDAAYLELARRRSLPLATLDRRLRDACAAVKVTVL